MRFRDLVKSIAASEGRRVALMPVSVAVLFRRNSRGRGARLEPSVRSDSVISFLYYDRHPDFSLMRAFGIDHCRISQAELIAGIRGVVSMRTTHVKLQTEGLRPTRDRLFYLIYLLALAASVSLVLSYPVPLWG